MPDDNALKQELLALEQRYWNAIKDKDAQTASALSDDPCLVVGAQGVGALSRKALANMMKQPSYELLGFTLDEVHLERMADNVAALAYTVTERLTVDGKPVSLKAHDSSVWVRRAGRWSCALHTESIAGDPFGRR
jgi:ketosteroid isomerase-like protein